jgi:spoIIIJ-associated protein
MERKNTMSTTTPENPESVNSQDVTASPLQGAVAAPKVSPEEVQPTAHEILSTLLKMLHFETELQAESNGQNLRFLIKCEDAGRLIGRGGNNLSGLQFLLNRLIFRKMAGAPRVYIDVEGFKEQIDGDVLKRAQAVAEQVRRWGEPLELASMNSYERRVIHQHFTNDPEIVVESVADGKNPNLKRMILKPRT